jgi:polysaccharide pyruvyl transferase WcaK-like protein
LKTLFLGSYGFGNLGDELCLIEAMQAFPSSETWAYSDDRAFTRSGVPGIQHFIRERPEIKVLKPERVVLGGGGVGFFPSIRDSLHWMDDAFRLGAQCHIHNIGVARMEDLSWAESVQVQRVLNGLTSCSVRDDMSWFAMKLWPAKLPSIGITQYPERLLPGDDALVKLLPKQSRLLGISLTGQGLMRRALQANQERVIAKLAPYRGYSVVPIISTVSLKDPEEDDVAGFEVFRKLFLGNFDIVCPQFLEKTWWRKNMTPLRLKGLIGGLDIIFTQRKHNLIHAISTQTPAVGIFPAIDDSIARIFFSLRDRMPLNSSQLALPTENFPL